MRVDYGTCIYEYERILLGLQKQYTLAMQGGRNSYVNKKEFGYIWNYAITKLLGWTPEEALVYMTQDIVKKLKLDTTYYAIDFNPAISFIGNYRFALQYAFPEEVSYNFRQETLAEYKRVAKKEEWQNDKSPYKYHKNFFSGTTGYERAKICLNYAVQSYLSDMTTEELYDFFANKTEARKFLSTHNLDLPARILYQNDILSFFHDSYDKRNYFYYYANVVNQHYAEVTRKNKTKNKKQKADEA